MPLRRMTPKTSCVTKRRSCGGQARGRERVVDEFGGEGVARAGAVQHVGRDLPGGRHDSTSGPKRHAFDDGVAAQELLRASSASSRRAGVRRSKTNWP